MVVFSFLSSRLKKRYVVAGMLFMSCLSVYVMRVNLSLNIIAMTTSTAKVDKELPNYGPRYEWSQDDQALLLGAYFYGYLVGSFPSGTLAEFFGGNYVIGLSMMASGLLTLITPFLASLAGGKWFVFSSRVLIGLFSSTVYPACHFLISRWAPPDEKGIFVATLMGGTFGTVVTWPITGLIIEHFGWPWAFYSAGVYVLIFSLLWHFLVYNTPSVDRHISKEEQEYIENSLKDNLGKSKKLPPYKTLLMSLPFLSLMLLHYGNVWGLYFLITATPKFLNEILGFNVARSGYLGSLPHIARFLCSFILGAICDYLRRKNLGSMTFLRKLFCLPSHIIPGLTLIILAIFVRDPYVCIGLMVLSLGFNGASSVTNLANTQDLAPNFAGTIYGIINGVATTAGFLSPLVVATFTKEENTLDQWKWVFVVGAAIYIIPAIIFWFFGSGKVQKWNDSSNTEDSTVKP